MYTKNKLKQVVFRVDFSRILELDLEGPAKFQQNIRSKFPNMEEQKGFELMIIDGNQNDVKKTNSWIFTDKDKNKQVALGSNFLAISYLNETYKNYFELNEDIKYLLRIFRDIYCVELFKRIGLRYINIFDETISFDNIKEFFNEKIITEFNIRSEKNKIIQSISSFEYEIEKERLNLKFGWINRNYPKSGKLDFVLDLDIFREEIEFDYLEKITKEYNEIITKEFEDCITPKTRETILGEKNE